MAGSALAITGLVVYAGAWVGVTPPALLGLAMLLGLVVALLGVPGGWVLQGGWSGYTKPEGWGVFRGWSRRTSLLGGVALAFVLLNFVAILVLQTPAAFTRGVGSLLGVMGVFATASAPVSTGDARGTMDACLRTWALGAGISDAVRPLRS